MNIPGLRSPGQTVGGLVFFGRCLDKIRLHAAGKLPADYNLGKGFDGRLCTFLKIEYPALVAKTLAEKDDTKVLEWCYQQKGRPTEDDLLYINSFLMKRGWRDETTTSLEERKKQLGFAGRADIKTWTDLLEVDEGRPPAGGNA